MSDQKIVRTRIAPSPTGFLHIGNLRTALFSYALAKHFDGQFVLRIEDTDQKRYNPKAVEVILQSLQAYKIAPDEGAEMGGPHAPYYQSQRLEIYQEHAHKLVEQGGAYYCFLDETETKQLQEEFRRSKKAFRSPHRDLDVKEAKARIARGDKYVVRQKLALDQQLIFTDGWGQEIKFNTNDIDEWVMLKSDGFPTYNFAVVIDDHLMDITHVFRGVEFVASAPKNLLLYEAFGWEMPHIFHLPVLMDAEGGKMSKRKGAVSSMEFVKLGYLPEAVLNFLMFLGWSSPEAHEFGEKEREIYNLVEFVQLFDVKDLNRSNPVFNREKLDWFNRQYLAAMDPQVMQTRLLAWLAEYAEGKDLLDNLQRDENLVAKLQLVQTRVTTLQELVHSLRFFYERPHDIDWEIKQLKNITPDLRKDLLQEFRELITGFEDNADGWWHETWEQAMRQIGDKYEVKHGDVFMLLRVAVCGSPFSPPLFESLQVLGKTEILERLIGAK